MDLAMLRGLVEDPTQKVFVAQRELYEGRGNELRIPQNLGLTLIRDNEPADENDLPGFRIPPDAEFVEPAKDGGNSSFNIILPGGARFAFKEDDHIILLVP